MLSASKHPHGDKEEMREEDTEDRETTQTDTDESVDEMRQAADYVEHVEVRSRFLHDSDISDIRRILT